MPKRIPWGAFHRVREFDPDKDNIKPVKYNAQGWEEFDRLPRWYQKFIRGQNYDFIVQDLLRIYLAGAGVPDDVKSIYQKAVDYAKRIEAREMGVRGTPARRDR
jgi:hypothetical protein